MYLLLRDSMDIKRELYQSCQEFSSSTLLGHEIGCITTTGSIKIQDTVWNKTEYNDVWRDHNRIQEIFPDFFKVLLDEHGNRVSGGFRNFGKVRTSYSMCYKASQKRKETTTGYDNLVATMEEYEKVEKPKKDNTFYHF